jgi:inhibitor of nuclear factor kappa-B kinase subunit alpha
MTVFSGQKWVFQQDSAPAHKAKTTQGWLRRNVLAFISAKDWPSGSPDLNSLDYKLWAVLEDMACQKHHNNLDSVERVCAVIEWPEHLKAFTGAQGSQFE